MPSDLDESTGIELIKYLNSTEPISTKEMLNTPSLSLLVFLLFFGMEPLSLVFQHYVLFFSSLEVAAFLYLEYLLPEASEGACSESLVWQRSQAS